MRNNKQLLKVKRGLVKSDKYKKPIVTAIPTNNRILAA